MKKKRGGDVLILSASWGGGELKPTVLSEIRAKGKVEGRKEGWMAEEKKMVREQEACALVCITMCSNDTKEQLEVHCDEL